MSKTTLVAVDTNILIYLTTPPDRAAPLQRKATALFEQLRADKQIAIALPSIVIGEYLSHSAYQDNLAEVLGELQTQFIILPFDTKAAKIYARLMHHKPLGGVYEQYKAQEGIPRRCIHADLTILATVEAHGVATLYTGERKDLIPIIAQKAALRIEVKKLDDIITQSRLL